MNVDGHEQRARREVTHEHVEMSSSEQSAKSQLCAYTAVPREKSTEQDSYSVLLLLCHLAGRSEVSQRITEATTLCLVVLT